VLRRGEASAETQERKGKGKTGGVLYANAYPVGKKENKKKFVREEKKKRKRMETFEEMGRWEIWVSGRNVHPT